MLLHNRRPARQRQNHDNHHADHGRHRGHASGVGMVVQRGGAAKGADGHFILGMPYILWDNIPRGLQISCPHIERSCTAAYYSDRRLGVSEIARAAPQPSTSSPATISGRRATWPHAASTSGLPAIAPTPRTGNSRIRTQSIGPSNHRGDITGGALHHPARKSPAQDAARRGRQDPLQDVVAAGRVRGRARGRADRRGARLSEVVHRAGGGGRGIRHLSPTCSRSCWRSGRTSSWRSEVAGLINNPKPGRGRAGAARLFAAGRSAQPRVFGQIHRPVAEKAPRWAGYQRRAHACAAFTDE